MEGLSERAYAERTGLSRGAVQKARKNGRLVLFADGSINAAASDARRGEMTDPDQQLRSRGGLGVCAAYAPLIFGLCSAVLLLERRSMSSLGSPGRGHCEAIAGLA